MAVFVAGTSYSLSDQKRPKSNAKPPFGVVCLAWLGELEPSKTHGLRIILSCLIGMGAQSSTTNEEICEYHAENSGSILSEKVATNADMWHGSTSAGDT